MMGSTLYCPTPVQVALGGIVVLVIALYTWMQNQRQKYPPGPSAIFSNLLLKHRHIVDVIKASKLAFGNVVTLHGGNRPLVILSGYDIIHKAFVDDAEHFSSRPPGLGNLLGCDKDAGLIFSPNWKELRKLALSVLRDHGMGKIDMEGKILEECDAFTKEIEKNCASPFDVNGHLQKAVSNVICNVVFGSRFEYADPVFTSLINVVMTQTHGLVKMVIVQRVPFLHMLPGDIFGYHKFLKDFQKNLDYFSSAIKKHEEQLDVENPRDFIDAYLIQMTTRTSEENQRIFDGPNLLSSISHLFVAGADTTSTTLRWAWLYMILHPEVQQRVQAEIDTVIGNRSPSLKDKALMPYTEAVLTEVLRVGNTAPMSLPHKVDKDVVVGGHVIPKDTEVNAFLMDVHMDDKNYPKPEEFQPERFLDKAGKFEKPLKFCPFRIGRRVCLGESLARAELYLFFTSILQHFSLKAPEGAHMSTEAELGLTRGPKEYKMLFTRR